MSNEAMVSSILRLDVALLDEAPIALARLHCSRDVGDRIMVRVRPDDGRWEPETVVDLAVVDTAVVDTVVGAGFDVVSVVGTDVVAQRARTLPDTVGAGMHVLVCGLNPSLVAADAGFGYAGPTNRFWRAVAEAGLVTTPRDPIAALEVNGVGMTDLVRRATPSASDLDRQEYVDGTARVQRLAERLHPGVVLFVGLAGWRAAVDRGARPGLQPEPFGGVPAYVMPSTSGRNAATTYAELVDHVRAAVRSLSGPASP